MEVCQFYNTDKHTSKQCIQLLSNESLISKFYVFPASVLATDKPNPMTCVKRIILQHLSNGLLTGHVSYKFF